MADDKNDDAVDAAAGQPVEAEAVTGRPNDIPIEEPQSAPLGGNSSFADRAKANKVQAKQVSAAENKSVDSAESKTTARKATRSTKKG